MKNTSASKSGTSERTAKNPAKPISKTSQAVRHDLRKLRHHLDEDPEFSDEETSDETSSDYEDEENVGFLQISQVMLALMTLFIRNKIWVQVLM